MDQELRGYRLLLTALFCTVLWVHHVAHRVPPLPPGPVVLQEPEQSLIEGGTPWTVKDYTVTPLASYDIRARVLHTERYYYDREADLSPLDLALGWRSMSDSAILKRLKISQFGRWYYFHYMQAPIAEEDIIAHSANNHILPATPEIAKQVKSVRVDDIVHLKGYLVSVQGKNGYHWVSSLTRTDSGAGSCEVFWVDSVEIETRNP